MIYIPPANRKAKDIETRRHPFPGFDKDRGFHFSEAHKAAEELRSEGKGSHDPVYSHSKKNR